MTRPSDHIPRRERYLAHTDAQRAAARAAARVAQADLTTAVQRMKDAVAARDRAVFAMHDAGIPKTHIAATLGLNAHSGVDKILERVNGDDRRAARKLFERIGRKGSIVAAAELEDAS